MSTGDDVEIVLLRSNGPELLRCGDGTDYLSDSPSIELGVFPAKCEKCGSVNLLFDELHEQYRTERSMGPEICYDMHHYNTCAGCETELWARSEFFEYPKGMLTFLQVEPGEDVVFENIGGLQAVVQQGLMANDSVSSDWNEHKPNSGEIFDSFDQSSYDRSLQQAVDALRNATNPAVLVLGPHEHEDSLRSIEEWLNERGFDAYLVMDLPNQPENSANQSIRMLMFMASFSVMLDKEPSGHIAEYIYGSNQFNVLARLEPPTGPSSAMIGATEDRVDCIQAFPYDQSVTERMEDVVEWAETKVKEIESDNLDRYDWYTERL